MSFTPLILDYLQGPIIVRGAVFGMTQDQLLARPVAGKWSTLEVVCHLADFEPVFVDRMKRVIAMEQPQLVGADENRFAATLAYHQRDLGEELAIIDATRSQFARILRQLPGAAWQRTGIHNERGPLTLEQILRTAIRHIHHHIAFVHEKRRALGLPVLEQTMRG